MQRVVLIIPTYNEAGNVESLLTRLAPIFAKLPTYHCQVLFVDDSSPDGTGKLITRLRGKYPFVTLLTNKKKGGLGHAYRVGMAYALKELQADIVFEFDADLSHDPDKIPAMLAKMAEGGYGMVMGARYLKGGGIPTNWPPHRKFLSIVGNLFMRVVMLNFAIHDWTTGYRAIRADVVRAILPLMQNQAFSGYTWQIGFLVKTIQAGYTIGEVPFYFQDRTLGHSKLGPEYIINTLGYIMKVRLSQIIEHRLFKFVVTGGTGALVQLTTLQLYRPLFAYQLAFFLAIETAVVSNFILSNAWTFADRKLKASQIPGKFVTFNLASAGSIIIQQILAYLGENFIGLFPLFTLPVVGKTIDTGLMYAVVGILIGMFWNFFAYSHLVWKKK